MTSSRTTLEDSEAGKPPDAADARGKKVKVYNIRKTSLASVCSVKRHRFSFYISMHNIKRDGMLEVKKLSLDNAILKKSGINPEEVTVTLDYYLSAGKVIPVWYVQYDNFAFLIDAQTGDPAHE